MVDSEQCMVDREQQRVNRLPTVHCALFTAPMNHSRHPVFCRNELQNVYFVS